MSDAGKSKRDMTPDEALALDYALGILREPDLGVARLRADHDAEFALLVSRHLMRLADDSGEEATVVPRPETWDAIVARIKAPGTS